MKSLNHMGLGLSSFYTNLRIMRGNTEPEARQAGREGSASFQIATTPTPFGISPISTLLDGLISLKSNTFLLTSVCSCYTNRYSEEQSSTRRECDSLHRRELAQTFARWLPATARVVTGLTRHLHIFPHKTGK